MVKNKNIILLVGFLFLISILVFVLAVDNFPTVVLNDPANGSVFTSSLQNLSANFTDDVGISTAMIYVYNSTGLFNYSGNSYVNASGGTITTIIENGKNYTVHTFTSNGTLNVTSSGNVEVLVVGGGGGATGGWSTHNYGAGAAGGTARYNSSVRVSGNVTVVVGAGGSGVAGVGQWGSDTYAGSGRNSSFGSIVATGGNGSHTHTKNGASNADYIGGTGGSDQNSAGGAGAGGNGSANGGMGYWSSINGTLVGYGGGGAGIMGSPETGSGGGIWTQPGGVGLSNGRANSGGGGGGTSAGAYTGGSGGSGIVIVRYLTPTSDGIVTSLNKTSLMNFTDGIYNWFAQIYDSAGQVNTTSNRTFTVDTPSIVNLISPANASSSNSISQTLVANFSDAIGLKNATLWMWNATGGVYNGTSTINNYGKAMNFSGSSQFVTMADSNSLDVDYITLSAWIKKGVVGSGRYPIVDKWGSDRAYALYSGWVGSNNNQILFVVSHDGGYINACQSVFSSAITDTNWHLVTATYNGSLTSIYIDGILNASTSCTIGTLGHGSGQFRIGKTYDDGGNTGYWNGLMDEVLIFNRSLTDSEISQLYNNGYGFNANSSVAPFNNALVSGWHFDEGTGTTAYDLTGKNNGTLTGATWTTGIVPSSSVSGFNFNFSAGTLSSILSAVVNLTQGVYNWAYQAFDIGNNSVISENNTLTIDTTSPSVVLNSPENTLNTSTSTINFTANVSDNIGLANATLNIWNANGADPTVSTIYDYTGSDQTYTVPAGVTSIKVKMWGAGGGGGTPGGWVYGYAGGGGGYTEETLSVTPGQV